MKIAIAGSHGLIGNNLVTFFRKSNHHVSRIVRSKDQKQVDDRGNLFFQIMRLVDEMKHKPEVLFLENVKNFKGHDKGRTFDIVCKDIIHNIYNNL